MACDRVKPTYYTNFYTITIFNSPTFFSPGATTPTGGCILQLSSGAIASSRTRFLDHTQRRATVGRIPLDE